MCTAAVLKWQPCNKLSYKLKIHLAFKWFIYCKIKSSLSRIIYWILHWSSLYVQRRGLRCVCVHACFVIFICSTSFFKVLSPGASPVNSRYNVFFLKGNRKDRGHTTFPSMQFWPFFWSRDSCCTWTSTQSFINDFIVSVLTCVSLHWANVFRNGNSVPYCFGDIGE